ncbi:MAG: phage virion morphogenesis protein [Planctomycetota bacterium]|jgi:hypothetical protein
MATVPLTSRFEGVEGLKMDLRELAKRTKDLRPAFHKIDKHVSTVFRRQFGTEGAFGGERWDPLKPETIKARRRQSGGNRGGILRNFNRLWGSLVKVGPESIQIIRSHYYERGTAVPYAEDHQEGKGSLPIRKIVPDPMPDSVIGTWEKVIATYIAGIGQ